MRRQAAGRSQPADLSEGLSQAYESVSVGFQKAAQCVIAVPVAEYEQVGPSGVARSVVRAVPVALFSPVIGATEALSKMLLGARNSVDPDSRTPE